MGQADVHKALEKLAGIFDALEIPLNRSFSPTRRRRRRAGRAAAPVHLDRTQARIRHDRGTPPQGSRRRAGSDPDSTIISRVCRRTPPVRAREIPGALAGGSGSANRVGGRRAQDSACVPPRRPRAPPPLSDVFARADGLTTLCVVRRSPVFRCLATGRASNRVSLEHQPHVRTSTARPRAACAARATPRARRSSGRRRWCCAAPRPGCRR